ncbi:MbtH family protein [Streptomyces sp. NPDC090045]|uniref:MbtH family protein n=1 Tax=Streptomyces sp. NPDC090045 TaxID=3365927 RepID=UPI0037F6C888
MSADRSERHLVVVNEEEQYSIWPEGRELPTGWRAVQEPAPKEQCLEYIETHWTDMRPLSLRRAMVAEETIPVMAESSIQGEPAVHD